VRLSEQVVSGLADLIELRDRIRPVVEAAMKASPSYGMRSLGRAVDTAANSSPGDSSAILSALLLVRRLQEFRKLDSDDTVLVVSLSLKRFDHFRKFAEGDREKWNETAPDVVWALDQLANENNPVLISEKAESVAWSHQNILFSTRIITDVRPVFNADGTKVEQVIVTSNLHLEYAAGNGMQEKLVLAMDALDVAELRRVCERAEVKMQTCLKEFEAQKPIAPPVEMD
jgi:hypothetical protein